MIKTLCAQRKRFIDAQLSVPPSNPKGRPLTPSIKSHGLHDLGIYCRAEILRGQTPQMFIDATERLENAFDAELEVRRVDQRHIDIIFLLRNPLAGIRNAGFGFESYALDDSDAESNREPSTTSEDEW
jgi:hypothetical protein